MRAHVRVRGGDPERPRPRTKAALLRRILVPLAKIRACREAIGAASQALELLGGNGYMEDWPMARQLRDAQCHTIWEGTENILLHRRPPGHALARARTRALLARVERALDGAGSSPGLGPVVDAVAQRRWARPARRSSTSTAASNEMQLLHARRFAYLLADLVEGALLLDEASWQLERDGDARKAVVAAALRPEPARPAAGPRHPRRRPHGARPVRGDRALRPDRSRRLAA